MSPNFSPTLTLSFIWSLHSILLAMSPAICVMTILFLFSVSMTMLCRSFF